MATNEESAAKLGEEILAEAHRESEGIINRARQYADDIVNTAGAEADKVRKEILERARAEAERRKELILAAVPVESGRLRLKRIESLLESINEDACTRLRTHDGFKYREVVAGLAVYAAGRMAGASFIIRVPEGDRIVWGNDLTEEVQSHMNRQGVAVTVAFDPEISPGSGVIIDDEDGHQTWDMRLLKRLERMWPELRQQVAVEVSLIPRTESGRSTQ